MRILSLLLIMLLPALAWADAFKVAEVKGAPLYRAKGQLKAITIVEGAELIPGGRIKMKDGEFLKLSTPMGDDIQLSGKTYMRLEALSSTANGKSVCQLELFQGIAKNKVHKLQADSVYTVRTPTAVAGVRGTEFQCEVAETGETEVFVLEGEVEVESTSGDGESVSVGSGEKAKVKTSGSVAVVEVKNIEKRTTESAEKAGGSEAKADGDKSSDASGDKEGNENEGAEDSEEGEETEEDVDDDASEEAAESASEEAVESAIEEAIEQAIEEAIEEALETIEDEAQEEVIDEITNSIEATLETLDR